MPAVSVSPFGPKPQFVDAAGNPLVGGKLFFYVGGSTSTKQANYTNSIGNVANTNPLILNILGEPQTEIWFTNGQLYKVVLAPSTDTDPPTNPIWSIDNLQGNGSSGGTSTDSEWILNISSPTFISANSFSLSGNQTQIFHIGRRLQLTTLSGMVYGRITNAVFSSLTTVTVQMDGSEFIDASLSAVYYSILSNNVLSLPERIATTTGVVNVYAATVGAARLVLGDEYKLNFAIANDGVIAPTLNLDGLGARSLLLQNGVVPTAGQINGEHQIRATTAGLIVLNPIIFQSANQLQMEANTLTNVFASPGTIKYHPATAKYIGFVTAGASPIINMLYSSAGTPTVTRNGAGDYTIGGCGLSGAGYPMITTTDPDRLLSVSNPTGNGFRAVSRTPGGSNSDANFYFVYYGDLP